MKAHFKLSASIGLLALLLTGCNSSGKGHANSNSESINLYLDKTSASKGTITFTIRDIKCSKGFLSSDGTYDLSFKLTMLSSSPKQVAYTIPLPTLIRENDGAEYSPTGFAFYPATFNVECDIERQTAFNFVIPSDNKDDKYCFSYHDADSDFNFHLYEMPDELRKSYTLECLVDGESVRAVWVLEGKEMVIDDWIKDDFVYGCHQWYSDEEMKKPMSSVALYGDTKIYGVSSSILKYDLPDGINSSFVSGYNFIPSNHDVVVPKEFDGKRVYCILAGTFSGAAEGMRRIYIPSGVRVSKYNFSNCVDLKTIYFGGAKEEWETVNEAEIPDGVTVKYEFGIDFAS